jgi:hypothetical protein
LAEQGDGDVDLPGQSGPLGTLSNCRDGQEHAHSSSRIARYGMHVYAQASMLTHIEWSVHFEIEVGIL